MKATTDGISLSRVETKALLAFASQEEADTNKWGVNFRVTGEKVFARATNGYASFELEGINEGMHEGEWMVARKFIVDAQKQLDSKQVAWLEFKGKSLHEAVIKENDKHLGTWTSASDVAIPQFSFPWDNVHLPNQSRRKAHCSAISTPYLKLAMLAAEAVGVESAYWYAPGDVDGPLIFTVGHDQKTSGIGCIKPLPANVNAGDEDDDDARGDKAAE